MKTDKCTAVRYAGAGFRRTQRFSGYRADVQRPRVGKVLCYVVRRSALLVFRHRGIPEAGIQVPAGTMRDAEQPPDAAIRETFEETGHPGFTIARELGSYWHEFDEGPRHELHLRHVFELCPPPGLPDQWAHFAEDAYWFEFFWLPIVPDLRLAGDQHAFLDRLGMFPE